MARTVNVAGLLARPQRRGGDGAVGAGGHGGDALSPPAKRGVRVADDREAHPHPAPACRPVLRPRLDPLGEGVAGGGGELTRTRVLQAGDGVGGRRLLGGGVRGGRAVGLAGAAARLSTASVRASDPAAGRLRGRAGRGALPGSRCPVVVAAVAGRGTPVPSGTSCVPLR